MTVTTPSEQPHHPGENATVSQPPADVGTEGSRRSFFTTAAAAFIGKFLAGIASDARREMLPKVEDWF